MLLIYDTLTEPALAVFAYVVAIWGVLMLEVCTLSTPHIYSSYLSILLLYSYRQFWKRKEKLLSLRWGTVHFEDSELERPGQSYANHYR